VKRTSVIGSYWQRVFGTTTVPSADPSSTDVNTWPPGRLAQRWMNSLDSASSGVTIPSSTNTVRPPIANRTSVPAGEVTWTSFAPFIFAASAFPCREIAP